MIQVRYFKSYWFWFFVTIALISFTDFIDHLLRSESYFRDIWIKWLLFTVASTVMLCVVIYSTHRLVTTLFRLNNLIIQSLSIILGLITHVYLSGPTIDRVIFGEMTLNFSLNPVMFIAGLFLFYIVRLLTFLVTRNFRKVRQDGVIEP